MFAITTMRSKTVHIKPIIFSPVARQPALTWQAVCTQIVVRELKYYHPSMKRIRSPSAELWHILAVYIMCPYGLDLFSPKLDYMTQKYWKFTDVLVFEIFDLKV